MFVAKFAGDDSQPMALRISQALLRISCLLRVCAILLLPGAAAATTADSLLLNTSIEKPIQTGETQSYPFEANAGQYVRFHIGRSTARLQLVINGVDGRALVRSNCHRCEALSLSFLPIRTGTYTLLVISEEGANVKGRYDLTLAEARPAIASDRKRLVAEKAMREADSLRAEWTAEALQKALAKYRAALFAWQTSGDRAGQSRALRALGDAYRSIGELQKARNNYLGAYRLAGDDVRLKAGAALGLGHISITEGDAQKGVEHGTEALALSRKIADRAGAARALFCIGDAYFYMNGQPAIYYEEALATVLEADDLPGQAMAYVELSYTLGQLASKQTQARNYLEKALGIWRLLGDKRGQAMTLLTLGHLASFKGDKPQALAFYYEAEPLVNGCGESDNEARLFAGIGYIQEGLGEQTSALQYYLKALTKWRAASFRSAEVEALSQVARLYHEMGENQKALSYLFQAKNLVQILKNSPTEAWVFAHMGVVLSDLGRESEALTAYQQALKEELHAIPWIRVLALTGTGKIYQRRGDHNEAMGWYMKALAVTRDSHLSFDEISTLNHIARAQRDSGNLDAALTTLNRAIDSIESQRLKMAGQSMRLSYFATTRDIYELTIDVHMRLSQREQNHQYVSKAFELTEQSRARSLLDMLLESKAALSPDNNVKLLEEESELLSHIATKNRELAEMYAKATAQAQIKIAERQLEELLRRNEVVQSLMRDASPRYAALTRPEPLKLSEIQQLLDSDTLLLEYSLGDDESYLWAITRDSIASYALPAQAQIEKAARQVYELLIAPNKSIKGESRLQRENRLARADAEYPKAALQLSQMILAPVASRMANKRIVIVADGALQYIPFAALPVSKIPAEKAGLQSTEELQPLIAEHELITLPSASALSAIRRELESRKPAPKAVAVIADPVFTREDAKSRLTEIRQREGSQRPSNNQHLQAVLRQVEIEENKILLERLPFSREEAMAILAIAPQEESIGLLNFQANKQSLSQAGLHQYRIIHFATHGLLNSNHPALSKIVLSLVDQEGKPQDGLLQLHEIYRLKLPAELIVLSACQTALGKAIKGEGLVGLTRGFMYAGAARVVASLWNVNDAATAELMGHFYKYMLQEKQRPAEALRNAQLKMLRHRNWKAPYYWAAFTIQGEWK
jgi:CHAT domain-containing protein